MDEGKVQPIPIAEWQYITSYGDILTLKPCSAGLRAFVAAVGGLSKVKAMKNFNVAWIKYIDSQDHMEWVLGAKRIAYPVQQVIELAWDLSTKDNDVIKARIKATNKLLGYVAPKRVRKKKVE